MYKAHKYKNKCVCRLTTLKKKALLPSKHHNYLPGHPTTLSSSAIPLQGPWVSLFKICPEICLKMIWKLHSAVLYIHCLFLILSCFIPIVLLIKYMYFPPYSHRQNRQQVSAYYKPSSGLPILEPFNKNLWLQ